MGTARAAVVTCHGDHMLLGRHISLRPGQGRHPGLADGRGKSFWSGKKSVEEFLVDS